MKVKVIIGLVVLTVAIIVGVIVFWPGNNHVLRLPGVVEVQEVRLGSKVGGRVEEVLVKEGEIIYNNYNNKALVVFEAPELRNQKLQVKARLDQAIAEWQRAENGPRQEEKDAAK